MKLPPPQQLPVIKQYDSDLTAIQRLWLEKFSGQELEVTKHYLVILLLFVKLTSLLTTDIEAVQAKLMRRVQASCMPRLKY